MLPFRQVLESQSREKEGFFCNVGKLKFTLCEKVESEISETLLSIPQCHTFPSTVSTDLFG